MAKHFLVLQQCSMLLSVYKLLLSAVSWWSFHGYRSNRKRRYSEQSCWEPTVNQGGRVASKKFLGAYAALYGRQGTEINVKYLLFLSTGSTEGATKPHTSLEATCVKNMTLCNMNMKIHTGV